jgi:hypothetical protein
MATGLDNENALECSDSADHNPQSVTQRAAQR